MAHGTDFARMCSANDLLELCRTAKRRGFNRQADLNRLEDKLDPDGVNVLSVALWGHNMDNPGIPLHHRCQVLAKIRNSMEPAFFYLDVLDTDWNKLTLAGDKPPKESQSEQGI